MSATSEPDSRPRKDGDGKPEADLQENLYAFPYHYIADDKAGLWRISKVLSWGYTQLGVLECVKALISDYHPRSVLDFGCGDGRLLVELARRTGIAKLVGVDVSERALGFAAAMTADVPPGRVHLANRVEQVSGPFDVITMVETMEHLEDESIQPILTQLCGLLADNGALIVSVPTTNVRLNPKHYRHYSVSVLDDQVSGLFVIDRVVYLHRIGWRFAIIKRALHNRFVTLQYAPALRLLSQAYRRFVLPADERTGSHLVAVLRKRRS